MNKAVSPRHDLKDRVIGLLGGMGPLATTDFVGVIVLATSSGGGAGHLPVARSPRSRTPDRIAPSSKAGAGPSPARLSHCRH